MNIPFVDLSRQYLTIKAEIDYAVQDVIKNTAFIGGEAVDQFEQSYAKSCGVRFCIGVGNGTDALFIAMKVMGIGAGDEVITAANSYFATSEAITLTGAKPLFVDCAPDTYTIDVKKLNKCLEEKAHNNDQKVKALLPVHLYGRAADMKPINEMARQHKLKVIEDCAQAHFAEYAGRKVGSIGDVGCFSFYPSKNLGAFGDAGAIVTDNEELALRIRMYANHGQMSRYDYHCEGINSRLDGIQAAVLNIKLKYLDEWSNKRYQNAVLYHQFLRHVDGVILPDIPAKGTHVFHLFVVRVKKRDEVIEKLGQLGVPAIVHYPEALPNLSVYEYLGYSQGDFPVASKYQDEILSLPMYPELSEKQIKYISESLKGILNC